MDAQVIGTEEVIVIAVKNHHLANDALSWTIAEFSSKQKETNLVILLHVVDKINSGGEEIPVHEANETAINAHVYDNVVPFLEDLQETCDSKQVSTSLQIVKNVNKHDAIMETAQALRATKLILSTSDSTSKRSETITNCTEANSAHGFSILVVEKQKIIKTIDPDPCALKAISPSFTFSLHENLSADTTTCTPIIANDSSFEFSSTSPSSFSSMLATSVSTRRDFWQKRISQFSNFESAPEAPNMQATGNSEGDRKQEKGGDEREKGRNEGGESCSVVNSGEKERRRMMQIERERDKGDSDNGDLVLKRQKERFNRELSWSSLDVNESAKLCELLQKTILKHSPSRPSRFGNTKNANSDDPCLLRKDFELISSFSHRTENMAAHNGPSFNLFPVSLPQNIPDVLSKGASKFKRYCASELQYAIGSCIPHHVLGEGSYGIVYKGYMHKSKIAVKQLKNNSIIQALEEMSREVEIQIRTDHPNLVRLLGFCLEAKCLVYEHMSNGNLDDRLLCMNGTPPLHWSRRIRIAMQVAQGLQHLHSCDPPIVHRDIKPANILLDGNMTAKLGDVGLARIMVDLPPGASHIVHKSVVAGTKHYVDPEYLCARRCYLGPKSDVYSFGIVLLQLLVGKVPNLQRIEEAIAKEEIWDLLDPKAGDWPPGIALDIANLGIWCSELDRKHRPNLKSVVIPALEEILEIAEGALEHQKGRNQKGIKDVCFLIGDSNPVGDCSVSSSGGDCDGDGDVGMSIVRKQVVGKFRVDSVVKICKWSSGVLVNSDLFDSEKIIRKNGCVVKNCLKSDPSRGKRGKKHRHDGSLDFDDKVAFCCW